MSQNEQPAKIGLFFGPGWKKIRSFDKKIWTEISMEIDSMYTKGKEEGIYAPKGLVNCIAFLISIPLGVIYCFIATVLFTIGMTVCNLLAYIGFAVTWVIDKLYFMLTDIHMVCPHCKEVHKMPKYKCPSCGKYHDDLTPGKYGILFRRCECGQKLRCSVLSGRKMQQAFCPSCDTLVYDRENLPVCIPVIGGRSVGKTAYITAFAKTFFDEISVDQGWTVEHYSPETQNLYQEIKSDYKNGTTRLTETINDSNKSSTISFSFFLRGRGIYPERVIHIYDIAGETFVNNQEHEIQKQYQYCQGIIMMIDPFSILEVAANFQNSLGDNDRAGIGKTDSMSVIEAFLTKLSDMTGMSTTQKVDTPIAIVISKTDSAGVRDEIGEQAIQETFERAQEKYGDLRYMDIEDYMCRKFLQKYEMQNFLNTIDMKFPNNHFFSCSAIGHQREQGSYRPFGVKEPFAWIMKQTDKRIGKHLEPGKFGKLRISLEEEL